LVEPVLPQSRFIFVWRDPVMLAQSLLIARTELTGKSKFPYGLHEDRIPASDPIDDVCQQVEFLHALIECQLIRLKKDVAIIVDYSEFCRSPNTLLDQIQARWQLRIAPRAGYKPVPQFSESKLIKLPANEFNRLNERLTALKTPRGAE